MTYRTINVRPTTYQRLLRYKHMDMTFDDVIDNILDEVDPIEMYQAALKEHNKRLEAMNDGEYTTLAALKKKYKAT
ncbi:MAG: hypothetical protein HZB92_01800 [Euryarchaeota archaeon]|nr:hypothetical protein [Euryarchaeota archaeon]